MRSLGLSQTPGLVINVLGDIIQSSPPPRFGFWIPPGLRQVQDAKSPVLLELDSSVHAQKLSFHTTQEPRGHRLQEVGILQAGQMLNKGFQNHIVELRVPAFSFFGSSPQ